MGKIARLKKSRQEETIAQTLLPLARVAFMMRRGLRELVLNAGMATLETILEQERTDVCGPRYRHNPKRDASRMGHGKGELVLGGRRVKVSRPRARTRDNQEVILPSWSAFSSDDPLNDRAVEQMVIGVATRKYARSLEPLPEELNESGTSKSAVSRRFVAMTGNRLDEWLHRDLSSLRLVALFLDGITIAEHVVIVALGLDQDGYKHVLGLWEGATENTTCCKALLQNLVDRGISTERSLLFVVDGSKALAKGVRDFWGKRALIQRCQVHKKRNVLDELPESMRGNVSLTISQAYRSRELCTATKILKNLAHTLKDDHPGAAASLLEGLEETLTVVALNLPSTLSRSLATTNSIESLNSRIRAVTRNVKRWRGGQMILRWVGAAVLEASRGFRRIKGHRTLATLIAALKANDEKMDQALDNKKRAA